MMTHQSQNLKSFAADSRLVVLVLAHSILLTTRQASEDRRERERNQCVVAPVYWIVDR